MLTKDLLIRCIQMDETVKSAPTPVRVAAEELRELRRLALLGIEREERAERVGLAVLHWVADETPQSIHKDSERMAKRGLPAYALLLASIADAMEEP